MAKIKTIKGYDDYGYEIMDMYLPSIEEATTNMQAIVAQVGCTAEQMTDALNRLATAIQRMDFLEERLDRLEDKTHQQKSALECRVMTTEALLSELRSVLDAKTENPNQKDDLEISNRIVPSEDFLILGEIGWSSEIVDLDKTNMFLN